MFQKLGFKLTVAVGVIALVTISIFAYKTGFNAFDIGRTAAIAWITVGIVLAVSAPLLRYLFKATLAERH